MTEPTTARTPSRRPLLFAALGALLLAMAGAGGWYLLLGGGEPGSQPAASGATAAATSSTPPTPTPAPAATPVAEVDAALAMGKGKTTSDGSATATVYGYRHNVAKSAPRPDEQPGYVWGAVDVKVCISKTFTKERLGVSNGPWSLVYADDTQIGASQTGYEAFPKPEYPWTPKELAPGRCLRGWITFPVPGKQRPKLVEWAPEGEQVAPRWAVK